MQWVWGSCERLTFDWGPVMPYKGLVSSKGVRALAGRAAHTYSTGHHSIRDSRAVSSPQRRPPLRLGPPPRPPPAAPPARAPGRRPWRRRGRPRSCSRSRGPGRRAASPAAGCGCRIAAGEGAGGGRGVGGVRFSHARHTTRKARAPARQRRAGAKQRRVARLDGRASPGVAPLTHLVHCGGRAGGDGVALHDALPQAVRVAARLGAAGGGQQELVKDG
jgi:hypothetical protein